MPGPVDDHHPTDIRQLAEFLAEGLAKKGALAEGFVRNNVALDRYDARLFRELVETSEELHELAKASETPGFAIPTFGPLVLDIFTYFYKFVPSLVEERRWTPLTCTPTVRSSSVWSRTIPQR